MKVTWDYIVEQATSDNGLKLKDKLSFHYFNPHGVIAEKKRLDDQIRDLVDAGKVAPGWHIAYGTFNDYHYNAMRKLLNRKQPRGWDVNYSIQKQREENEKVLIKIMEVK